MNGIFLFLQEPTQKDVARMAQVLEEIGWSWSFSTKKNYFYESFNLVKLMTSTNLPGLKIISRIQRGDPPRLI